MSLADATSPLSRFPKKYESGPRMSYQKNAWLLLSCALLAPLSASDWPQFRGPQANGHVAKLDHPTTWDGSVPESTKNIAWTAKLEGSGWSSPVVTGDLVFVTSAAFPGQEKPKDFQGGVRGMRGRPKEGPKKDVEFRLSCLRLSSGDVLWSKVVENRKPAFAIHPSNTYATESPATDGEGVYVYFGGIGLVAGFGIKGEERWRVELGAFPTGADFGTGSSPSLADGRLFVQSDNDKSSFLVAIDVKSGKEIWRVKRDGRTSWSTPHPWSTKKGRQLVVCGAGTVVSYDPASGRVLWKVENLGSSFSSSPTSDSERVYFGNSGPRSVGSLVAVNADATGTLDGSAKEKTPGLAWVAERSGPGLASPVTASGFVYVVRRSILSCFDAATGKRVYRERLPSSRSIAASLWAGEGKVFLLDETGTTFVVKAGPEFELLGTNKIDDLFWSTPAVAGDRLLLRGAERIYCVGQLSAVERTASLPTKKTFRRATRPPAQVPSRDFPTIRSEGADAR